MIQLTQTLRSTATLVFLAVVVDLLTPQWAAADPTEGVPETACREVLSDIELAALPRPAIILVGERHGTREGPEAVGDIACSFAAGGLRVAILFETRRSHSETLASLDGGPDDRRRLCTGLNSFWSGAGDGRRSVAIAELAITAARLGRELNNPITLGAMDAESMFDRPEGMGPNTWRHVRMAANILTYASTHDAVIVNVGNFHPAAIAQNMVATTEPGTVSILKLRQVYAAGTAWNCQATGCGLHDEFEAPHYLGFVFSSAPEIQATDLVGSYDGVINIGAITASPPVALTDFCSEDRPAR